MIHKIITYGLASLSIFALSLNLASHPVENVDCIELNHFHDRAGKMVFEQVIFWDRVPETGRFHVRAWCLVDDTNVSNRPSKNELNGLYEVVLSSQHQIVLAKITSRLYKESWTTFDPERYDKKCLDESNRVSLVRNGIWVKQVSRE